MCNTYRIKILIQSFSNIITNSSSELFCKVHGKDLSDIEYILDTIFSDCDTSASIVDEVYDRELDEYVSCTPYVEFNLGCHLDLEGDLVKLVIEHKLNKSIGEGNYIIEYV